MTLPNDRPEILTAPKPEATAILAAGELIERHRSAPKRVADLLHGKAYVILKDADGRERIEWVTEQLINPTFRKGTVKLDDGKSFIAYVARHGTENTAIYARQSPAVFVAVIDEHPAAGPAAADGGVNAAKVPESPSWREFRAEFTPSLSEEWDTWASMDRKHFESTEKFAYFLEDNLPDIVDPPGAELMQVALNFRVNQAASYSNAQRLSDGHIEMAFQNTVEGSATTSAGKIKIPEAFRIEVPVFAGIECRTYSVDARFRYRLTTAGLKLWYELVRPHKVLEKAFNDLWAEIGDGTKRDILLGVPE